MTLLMDWYGRRMTQWENRLAFRTNNRVVRPFDWGMDWVDRWPTTNRLPRNGHNPEEYLSALNREAIIHSDEFYAYKRPTDFRLEGDMLRFTSAVHTPYPENNTVNASIASAKRTFLPPARPRAA